MKTVLAKTGAKDITRFRGVGGLSCSPDAGSSAKTRACLRPEFSKLPMTK